MIRMIEPSGCLTTEAVLEKESEKGASERKEEGGIPFNTRIERKIVKLFIFR